ncbi:hypothetical protein D9M71_258090 [compost metagenome]
MRIAPLAQAQIVQEVLPAPATQRIGAERLALFLEAAPEVDQCGEVGIRVLPLRMRLVGGLLALDRTLARVLHRKRAGHGEHFIETALMRRFQQHAAEARINGQARQLAAQRGELALAVHRREFLQQGEAVLDRLAVRRLDEGEGLDIAEAQVEHLQDHRRQVGAEDFRIGEGRPREEVLLAVQAHADARLDPPATALALVGAGLGHGLDGQALYLGAVAVAADPRRAAVDHVADTRYGQRGFGDVGGEHNLAPGHGLEDFLLLGRSQPCVQRQDFGVTQIGLAQHVGGIANLAFAGEEHQHVAGAFADFALVGGNLVQRAEDALVHRKVIEQRLAVLVHFRCQRAIPGVHRVGAAGYFDNGRVAEMLGEALQVDGRRSDDQLEVGPARQQGLEEAEEEVDVQAALVGLVDDDGVVAFEEAVVLGFGQQDAVGHQLDQAAFVGLVLETHLVAHQFTQGAADLFRDPRGHAACRQPARLGMADQAVDAAADLQADLRQLGGLARAGFAGDHQHLVLGQGRLDFVALGGDGQGIVVAHQRHAGAPRLHPRHGGLEALGPLRQLGGIRLLSQLVELPAQAMPVGAHGLIEALQELFGAGGLLAHRFR